MEKEKKVADQDTIGLSSFSGSPATIGEMNRRFVMGELGNEDTTVRYYYGKSMLYVLPRACSVVLVHCSFTLQLQTNVKTMQG